MTNGITTTTVRFRAPFLLAGADAPLPAGDYVVETEEDPIDGVSFAAFRRVATLLFLPPRPASPGRRQALPVDPFDLSAALERDRAAAESEAGPDASPPNAAGWARPHGGTSSALRLLVRP